MAIPIFKLNQDTGKFFDQHGNIFDALPSEVTGTVIVAAPWERLINASQADERFRSMIHGVMQANCHACNTLVGLSSKSQENLNRVPSSKILCMNCADKLEEMNA